MEILCPSFRSSNFAWRRRFKSFYHVIIVIARSIDSLVVVVVEVIPGVVFVAVLGSLTADSTVASAAMDAAFTNAIASSVVDVDVVVVGGGGGVALVIVIVIG
jgi:hypothetical protein